MTAVEIMQALQTCSTADASCEGCAYYGEGSSSCIEQVCKDAAELIEKQRAEIERLQKDLILKNDALLSINYKVKRIPQTICDNCSPDFNMNGKPVTVFHTRAGYAAVDALVEQIVKEAMAE